jgi:hypothetical protein
MKYRNKFNKLITRLRHWRESSGRVKYLNARYEYDRIADENEVFALNAHEFRDSYFSAKSKTGSFIDKKYQPYVIVNRVRYNLTDKVVRYSRTVSLAKLLFDKTPSQMIADAIAPDEREPKLHYIDINLLHGVAKCHRDKWLDNI